VALILGASITLGFSNTVIRYVFWIGLALVVAAVSRNGLEIVPVAYVVGELILISAVTRGGRGRSRPAATRWRKAPNRR